MADKRGKDLVKRLNYDELKDKITKEKKPKMHHTEPRLLLGTAFK